MAGPTPLYSVFEYLATLIAERDADEPFLLSQIQPAIRYKFPDFNFADYQLPGIKEFLLSGEKAGYFKLVNTGDIKTAYLAPGPKAIQQQVAQMQATEEMAASDPRRLRWMTQTMETMILAERGDQIVDAMKNVNALSPEFDSFLMAEGKAARLYPVRGKIQRLREFLKTYREKGQAAALAAWQTSRVVLRMPSIPPVKTAAAAQSLIWALLQGNMALDTVPLESLDNLFFAVLIYSREQMIRNKSWDWVVALNILEAEVRAIPRPVPQPQKKGLFGGKQQPVESPYELDENEIRSLVELLTSAAGADKAQHDETPTWQAFVNTPNTDTSYRFLVEHPKLIEDDKLLTWLEDQLAQNVGAGAMDAVKNLANKSALVIAARQFGLQQMRQQSAEIRNIYESVLDGARLLGILFGFLDAASPRAAAQYFQQHQELADTESIGPLIDDQTLRAVHQNDVSRYRRLTERADLWRNLTEFGVEEGLRQHERFLAGGRDDQALQAEMGITLLAETTSPDERQDIFGRYPPVASKDALSMITRMLDNLSFQGADTDEYNRYFEVKRLIERCLEIGVDRALAELK